MRLTDSQQGSTVAGERKQAGTEQVSQSPFRIELHRDSWVVRAPNGNVAWWARSRESAEAYVAGTLAHRDDEEE